MKTASTAMQTLLGTTRILAEAYLFTFTLKNGTVLNYTTWDVDLVIGGTTYKSHDVIISSGAVKQKRGLEPNELDLTCYPSQGVNGEPISTASGSPFLQACVGGLFDRAIVQRARVFCPGPVNAANPQTFNTYGAIQDFLGEITEVDVTRNTAAFKCHDATYLLNIQMPRRQFMPTCAWTFGDSNCGFNRASLTVSSTVGAGSSGTALMCGLAQAAGYFNYGNVLFTSGLNNGVSRAVQQYSPGSVTLTGPFPFMLNPGDNFNITPGCSKNLNANVQEFNGSVGNGNSPLLILNNNGAAAGTYNGYTITFTSGILDGTSAKIGSWSPGAASLSTFFNTAPNIGDAFNILSPGGVIISNGAVTTPLSSSVIPLGLPGVAGFYNNGKLQFTSGANVGQIQTISSWANGIATMAVGFSNVPAIGDQCTITTASATNGGTCTGYANTPNFGGEPFVPIPETAW